MIPVSSYLVPPETHNTPATGTTRYLTNVTFLFEKYVTKQLEVHHLREDVAPSEFKVESAHILP